MKWKLFFIVVFFMITGLVKGKIHPHKFDKAEFYAAMRSSDLEIINNEIDVIKGTQEKEKEGYEGALLMKKAELVKSLKERLSFFKQGRIKLETNLLADNNNTELHFLRLAIEEHAPKIVKYYFDIEKDKSIVINNFKNLSPVVQNAILDYCENSQVLHRKDFSLH